MRCVVFLVVALAGCSAVPADDGAEEPVADGQEPVADGQTSPGEQKRPVLNETVVTKPYTGNGVGPFAANTGCGGPFFDPGGPENTGGACFDLPPGTERIDFVAHDDLLPAVGVYVRYETDSAGFFCTEGTLRPPATPWVMIVMSESGCLGQAAPAGATTGEIEVTFQHA